MKGVIKTVKVIARATDEDKNLMVGAIKIAGGFILMSGDGINDTEALQMANVGVSMGSSCQVTKDASDLVIMDNDIKSIYHSIMWGRTIYSNVRKFIQFQMTMNISIVTIIFVSSCVMGTPPFSVIQLLWMNLVMDVLAAVSICTEPFDPNPKREAENFKLRRISRQDRIFNGEMWRNILPMAVWEIIVLIVLMYAGQFMFFDESFNIVTTPPRKDGVATPKLELNTMCFNTFMLMNIFNMLNCRVNTNELNIFTNLLNNKFFWLIFIFEMLVQVAFIWWSKNPLIGVLLNCTPQSLAMVITAWVLGGLILPLRALFTKFIPATAFGFMDKVDLETDTDNNCVTRCFSRIVGGKKQQDDDGYKKLD